MFSALEQLVGGAYPSGEAASSSTIAQEYATFQQSEGMDDVGDYNDDQLSDGMSMRLLCITSELLFVFFLPSREYIYTRPSTLSYGRDVNIDCFS